MDGVRYSARPIRVILANEPRLFREMLERVFKKQIDLQVVAEVLNFSQLPDVIARTGADWVVVSLLPNGELPDYADVLISLHPRIGVLAVAWDGSQVKVKSSHLAEEELVGISLTDLLTILHFFSRTKEHPKYLWLKPAHGIEPFDSKISWKKAWLN